MWNCTYNGRVDAVRNIADLRALDPVSHDAVQILGYHAVSDGGGGTFYFDPNLTAWAFAATNSDNGLSVTSSPFKTGDCIRLYGDSLPSGVSTGTDYYATRATGTGF